MQQKHKRTMGNSSGEWEGGGADSPERGKSGGEGTTSDEEEEGLEVLLAIEEAEADERALAGGQQAGGRPGAMAEGADEGQDKQRGRAEERLDQRRRRAGQGMDGSGEAVLLEGQATHRDRVKAVFKRVREFAA